MSTADRIFISYARADVAVAIRIVDGLRAHDVDPWIDVEDIHSGEDWDMAIDAALRDCDAFVVILSPESVTSDEVRSELRLALDEKKAIHPILVADCEIPRQLRVRQLVDLRCSPITPESLLPLAAALQADVPRPRSRRGERESWTVRHDRALLQVDGERTSRLTRPRLWLMVGAGLVGAIATLLIGLWRWLQGLGSSLADGGVASPPITTLFLVLSFACLYGFSLLLLGQLRRRNVAHLYLGQPFLRMERHFWVLDRRSGKIRKLLVESACPAPDSGELRLRRSSESADTWSCKLNPQHEYPLDLADIEALVS